MGKPQGNPRLPAEPACLTAYRRVEFPGRLDRLAASLPTSVKRVAESGVATADDGARMARCGYDLALVGSALRSAPEPASLASAMRTAARAARGLR